MKAISGLSQQGKDKVKFLHDYFTENTVDWLTKIVINPIGQTPTVGYICDRFTINGNSGTNNVYSIECNSVCTIESGSFESISSALREVEGVTANITVSFIDVPTTDYDTSDPLAAIKLEYVQSIGARTNFNLQTQVTSADWDPSERLGSNTFSQVLKYWSSLTINLSGPIYHIAGGSFGDCISAMVNKPNYTWSTVDLS